MFAIAGMKRERLKLKSAHGSFSGKMMQHWPKGPEMDVTGEMRGQIAIDGERFRYDITRPGWVIDPSTIQTGTDQGADPGRVTAEKAKGTLRRMYASDGARVTVWDGDQGFAVISKPEDFPNGRFISEYVDVRAAALFDRLAISRGWTLDAVFAGLDDMTAHHTVTVHDVGKSVWRIRWIMRELDWNTRWTLVLDTSHFTLLEYQCEGVELSKADREASWMLEWRNRTTWDERSGVWFPVHHEYHLPAGIHSRATETFEFDYAWDVVNAPVDPKLFTYQTFDLPIQVGIQDVSGPKPVLIRPPTIAQPSAASTRATTQRESWTAMRIVMVVNAIVLGLALVFFMRRRFRALR